MNTGLQDAANLGWKLAAVLGPGADPDLLDSYHDERHPVGRMVLRTSGGIVRLAMAHTPLRRAVRSLLARLVTPPAAAPPPGDAHHLRHRHRVRRPRRRPPPHRPPRPRPGPRRRQRLYELLRQGKFVSSPPPTSPAPRRGGGARPCPADGRVLRASWAAVAARRSWSAPTAISPGPRTAPPRPSAPPRSDRPRRTGPAPRDRGSRDPPRAPAGLTRRAHGADRPAGR